MSKRLWMTPEMLSVREKLVNHLTTMEEVRLRPGRRRDERLLGHLDAMHWSLAFMNEVAAELAPPKGEEVVVSHDVSQVVITVLCCSLAMNVWLTVLACKKRS